MFLLKLLILLLIFGTSFWIGLIISKKYVNRVKELKELKTALTMFETKIRFTYESVPEIFKEISEKIDGNIGNIFKNAANRMKEFSAGEAWNKSIEESQSNINEEDKNTLKNLGRLLGKTDLDGQISEIQLTMEFLNQQIDSAENERRKNEKMYKTLGGIIGLALVIILI